MYDGNFSEIQIWSEFEKIPISSDAASSKLKINVTDDATALDQNLMEKIDGNWEKIASTKPVKDNKILYLTAKPIVEGQVASIDTNVRGFRYTQGFNRNAEFQNLVDDLNKYKLLSISTHVHLLTNDNNKKLLFGTKTNQFNQISGFSGFPNALEDCYDSGDKKILDVYKTILNRLTSEMGHLTSAVKDITALGIVYVDTPGLRGTDTDYLIDLDESASKAQERFKESFQFDKELHVVDFEPSKICEYITNLYESGKKMSKYALGCQYLVFKSYFEPKEVEMYKKTIQNLGITLSDHNQTNYFDDANENLN
jgi:hypothetical protein